MKFIPTIIAVTITLSATLTQARDVNYDESRVTTYTLPAILKSTDNTTVTTPAEFETKRRPEILALFQDNVYGHTPPLPGDLRFEVTHVKDDALSGIATRKQIHISLPSHPEWQGMDMLLYIPNDVKTSAPVFVGLNFFGNHAITTETDVAISTRYMRPNDDYGIKNNRATKASRGVLARRWPLQLILENGYAVATTYCGDLEPDHADGWKDGIRAALSPDGPDTQWQPDQWGAISAWAWGISRMLDYCETDPAIDHSRAITIGHSRLGKTALWAAAQDQRFAMAVSNNSGEGGAALARRNYGETIQIITNAFPHWFANAYHAYANRPSALPVDQHMLVALMAPRPVYIASASNDRWADPRGEFLSAVHAEPAYKLYGKTGLGTREWPPVNTPVGETIGYHLREGKHDITPYDWQQYINFANCNLPHQD